MTDLQIEEPRELVGRMVRQIWVRWAREQDDPKPSWLLPWAELDDGQREVDMRIGEALFMAGHQAGTAELALHVGCRRDFSIGDVLRLLDDAHSPFPPSPVSAATGETGED
jgi:hypothetical protein